MENTNKTPFLQRIGTIFTANLLLIIFWTPDAAFIFMKMGHIDLTFNGWGYKIEVLNWLFYCFGAFILEFIILLVISNGNEKTGKIFAVASFFLMMFYYVFLDNTGQLRPITTELIVPAILASFICFYRALSIWDLADLYKKKLDESEKVNEVDPMVIEAQKAVSKADDTIKAVHRELNTLQEELKASKRETILVKIKHCKSEKVKHQLNLELQAL